MTFSQLAAAVMAAASAAMATLMPITMIEAPVTQKRWPTDESPRPEIETTASAADLAATRAQEKLRAARNEETRQIRCIASAMFHEAGNQGQVGQIAVAEVVIARARHERFGNTPCEVVSARGQFSFVRNGKIPNPPAAVAARFEKLARQVMDGARSSPVRGALYFHAVYVNPNWGYRLVGQIGDHLFYRPGKLRQRIRAA